MNGVISMTRSFMMVNKDGLEPGQSVDFETHQRIERQRAQRAKQPQESSDDAPKRRRPKE